MANLYLVTRKNESDSYVHYHSFVVAAEDEKDAAHTWPDQKYANHTWDYKHSMWRYSYTNIYADGDIEVFDTLDPIHDSWVLPNEVNVQLIGVASRDIEIGKVLCLSGQNS